MGPEGRGSFGRRISPNVVRARPPRGSAVSLTSAAQSFAGFHRDGGLALVGLTLRDHILCSPSTAAKRGRGFHGTYGLAVVRTLWVVAKEITGFHISDELTTPTKARRGG